MHRITIQRIDIGAYLMGHRRHKTLRLVGRYNNDIIWSSAPDSLAYACVRLLSTRFVCFARLLCGWYQSQPRQILADLCTALPFYAVFCLCWSASSVQAFACVHQTRTHKLITRAVSPVGRRRRLHCWNVLGRAKIS